MAYHWYDLTDEVFYAESQEAFGPYGISLGGTGPSISWLMVL